MPPTWSPDASPRSHRAALGRLAWLGVILALGLGGCRARQRSEASEAYRRELRDHQARFQEFQDRYPGLERRLGEARLKTPGQVPRLVERDLLPLLGRLSKGYASVVRSGRAYVALLPSSVEAREALRKQLDGFEEQQRLMEKIRRTYVDEAALFRKVPLDRAALGEIFARRSAAALRMQQGNQD